MMVNNPCNTHGRFTSAKNKSRGDQSSKRLKYWRLKGHLNAETDRPFEVTTISDTNPIRTKWEGLSDLLQEKVGGKPRITSNKRIIDTLYNFLSV